MVCALMFSDWIIIWKLYMTCAFDCWIALTHVAWQLRSLVAQQWLPRYSRVHLGGKVYVGLFSSESQGLMINGAKSCHIIFTTFVGDVAHNTKFCTTFHALNTNCWQETWLSLIGHALHHNITVISVEYDISNNCLHMTADHCHWFCTLYMVYFLR